MTPARHGYFDGRNQPRWIVIHTTESPKVSGGAQNIANYFASTPEVKSAHYTVDADGAVQSVREEDGAFHTTGFASGFEVNRNSIGIEHVGYARQTPAEWRDSYSAAELEHSAKLVANIARRWGIPVKHLTPAEIAAGEPGIAGHVEFNAATRTGSHTDPGANFPWNSYLAKVRGYQSPGSRLLVPVLAAAAVGAGVWWLASNPASVTAFTRRLRT